MNPKVNFYFNKSQKWQQELAQLRKILLDCQLSEVLKWGVPCYMYQQRNIALLHEFNDYCAILFIKGALLQDPDGLLVQQTANVQAARQLRFTSVQEILGIESTVKAYVYEAVEVEEAGSKVPYKETASFTIPEEFQKKLDEMPTIKTAFEALTPGRQRAYLLYFSAPKQAKTRQARIEKCLQLILDGKGLRD